MTLKQFIENILNERNSFSWKEQDPFQLEENSLGGVIPIIKKADHKRNYVLYEEAEKKGKIRITDKGNISKLKVTSTSDKPVFVRMGSIFTGDTQTRAASVSIFVMPNAEKGQKEVEVPVKCVHASHGIVTGASMVRAESTVPRMVLSSFAAGSNQATVWSNVRNYSCSVSRFHGSERSVVSATGLQPDNLLEVKRQVREAKKTVGDYIKKIPRLKNQVGVIIFDSKGVVGIEVFDHQDSWQAFQESIYEEYEDVLLAKQEEIVYKVDKVALVKQVKKFLKESTELKGKQEFEDGKAKTFLLSNKTKVGEFSLLASRVIHLLVMRKEKEPKAPQMGPTSVTNFGYTTTL